MTAQGMYYLIRALVTLIAIPFHEAGHALAAWLLGRPHRKAGGPHQPRTRSAYFDLGGPPSA